MVADPLTKNSAPANATQTGVTIFFAEKNCTGPLISGLMCISRGKEPRGLHLEYTPDEHREEHRKLSHEGPAVT